MTDSDPAGDLSRTLRTMATVGGQLVERAARLRAEQHRVAAQQSTSDRVDAERRIAQERRDLIDAGRLVYGPQIRDLTWDHPDIDRRVGEALYISEQLSSLDPAARTANDYLRREAAARYGDDADHWLHTAYQRFAEAVRETQDRGDAARHDAARGDAARHDAAHEDQTATHQPGLHDDAAGRDGWVGRVDRGAGGPASGVEDVRDESERANQQRADAEVLALGGVPDDVEDPASGWSSDAGHFPVMDEPTWREPDQTTDQTTDQRADQGQPVGHEQPTVNPAPAQDAESRGRDALDHAAQAHDRADQVRHGAPAEGIPEVDRELGQEFRIGQRVRRDGFPTDPGTDPPLGTDQPQGIDRSRGTGHTRPVNRSRDAARQRGRDRGR